MSSFLSNITKRHFGQAPLVTARKRALFEPKRFTEALAFSADEDLMQGDRNTDNVNTTSTTSELMPPSPRVFQSPTIIEKPAPSLPEDELAEHRIQAKPPEIISTSNQQRTLPKADANTISPSLALDNTYSAKVINTDSNEETAPAITTTEKVLLAANSSNLPKATAHIRQQRTVVQNHFEPPRVDADDSFSTEPTSLPNVKIHIGRIEVKATPQKNKPAPTRKARTAPKPKLSLEQYLKDRT